MRTQNITQDFLYWLFCLGFRKFFVKSWLVVSFILKDSREGVIRQPQSPNIKTETVDLQDSVSFVSKDKLY